MYKIMNNQSDHYASNLNKGVMRLTLYLTLRWELSNYYTNMMVIQRHILLPELMPNLEIIINLRVRPKELFLIIEMTKSYLTNNVTN